MENPASDIGSPVPPLSTHGTLNCHPLFLAEKKPYPDKKEKNNQVNSQSNQRNHSPGAGGGGPIGAGPVGAGTLIDGGAAAGGGAVGGGPMVAVGT